MHQSFRRHQRPGMLLLSVLAALTLFPAGQAHAADPVFPTASRIGLVPPEGFMPSRNFQGFEHAEKQASILMAELPMVAYETIDKEVTAELQKEQAAAPDRKDLTLGQDGRGFVLFGRQETGPQGPILKWTMVARIADLTAIVTAVVPDPVKDVVSDAAIRAAFATLAVRRVPTEELLSVLPFSMSQLAGFRIVRVQPGSAAMLTDGPQDAIETSEQPLLVVSLLPAATQPPAPEREGVARRLLGEVPGLKDVRVTRSEPLRVAGQQGYETMIEARDSKTGMDVNAVQWLRFGTGTLLRMVGIARRDVWQDTFQRFREVRDGIGPK